MTQKQAVKGLLCAMTVFLLMLVGSGAAFAHGGEGGSMVVQVDGYYVNLRFLESATIGVNPIYVQVLDEMGRPVNGAQVNVSNISVHATEQDHQTMEAGVAEISGKGKMSAVTPMSEQAPAHAGHSTGTAETSRTSTAAASHRGEQHGSSGEEPGGQATTLLESSDEVGEYAGAITLAQAGRSLLLIQLTIHGESLTAQFPLEVARSGAVYGILAGFFLINATIIGSAAILKRQNAPA